MKIFYFLFIISLLGTALTSCGGGEKKEQIVDRETLLILNERIDQRVVYTSADTTTVMDMANQYINLLKDGKYDDAVAMLVEVDEKNKTVSPLSTERTAQLKRSVSLFPIDTFRINNVKFYSELDTEVNYTINDDGADNQSGPSNAMRCVLSFRKIDDKWYPTIIDQQHDR